ncbi:MAG: hypothetical protein ACYSTL_05345 [Planctomycetota bacterium]
MERCVPFIARSMWALVVSSLSSSSELLWVMASRSFATTVSIAPNARASNSSMWTARSVRGARDKGCGTPTGFI